MSEFLTLIPPSEALAHFLAHVSPMLTGESMPVTEAVGRVTHRAIKSQINLPPFSRSTVDGFAVTASDTYGASETLPAYLKLIGEIEMGTRPTRALEPASCMVIHTGGMLPEGADAVVMVEHTQVAREGETEILRAVSVGSNVLQIGEDVKAGDEVVAAGRRLRAAEIGGLSALGLTEVDVRTLPKVGIISSGDEVRSPGDSIQLGQIYDVNSYSLDALVQRAGGMPVRYGIIPDEPAPFEAAARQAVAECDLVLFTAGSSVSVRDLTAKTIDMLGSPGVLVHGISVRPGKPTILAVCDETPVIGLPGNPVSALVIARIFVTKTIQRLLGLKGAPPPSSLPAYLTTNLPSQAGREDWIGVQLVPAENGYNAVPLFGKSNLIFTLAKADGLLKIPAPANGIQAGETVTIELLD